MNRHAGFTLIEVMMVVVIIGVLSAIAIPNYTDYLIRSRITQATSGLAERRARMEQFFQDNHVYYRAAAGGNPQLSSPACALDTTTSRYFDFSCPNPRATTYTLRATGKDSMAGFTYNINQANTRTSTVVNPAPAAWRTAQVQCWVTSKGGGC